MVHLRPETLQFTQTCTNDLHDTVLTHGRAGKLASIAITVHPGMRLDQINDIVAGFGMEDPAIEFRRGPSAELTLRVPDKARPPLTTVEIRRQSERVIELLGYGGVVDGVAQVRLSEVRAKIAEAFPTVTNEEHLVFQPLGAERVGFRITNATPDVTRFTWDEGRTVAVGEVLKISRRAYPDSKLSQIFLDRSNEAPNLKVTALVERCPRQELRIEGDADGVRVHFDYDVHSKLLPHGISLESLMLIAGDMTLGSMANPELVELVRETRSGGWLNLRYPAG